MVFSMQLKNKKTMEWNCIENTFFYNMCEVSFQNHKNRISSNHKLVQLYADKTTNQQTNNHLYLLFIKIHLQRKKT